MKKRDLLVGGAGALAVGSAVATSPNSVGGLVMGTAGAVSFVGDKVSSVLNSVVPTATAGIAAPLASAASGMYLTNGAMNMIGVENRIARGLALAGSAVAGYGAGSITQPFLIGGAVAKGTWDIGKMVWNSEALKKLGTSKKETT